MNTKNWTMVVDMLRQQPFGVLGTSREGHAYTSLVAFAAAADLDKIYFATTRATRKYHNLNQDNQVALLIDNRSDHSMSLYESAAVTAYGTASEVDPDGEQQAGRAYLLKHPHLRTFLSSPSTALFCIQVGTYQLVQRFQNVVEFQVGS